MTTQSYDADALVHLEGLDAVRKRPGMYIGSTDSHGVLHSLNEILDNATDEAVGGHGTRIEVILHPDGSVEIVDQGRGIPTGMNAKTKKSGALMALSMLHAGGKFNSSSYKASGGLHGVGSAVVNALSSRMDATIKQDGKVHRLCFQHGRPGTFDGTGPDAPFKRGGDIEVVGKMKRGESTGTSIRYWLDLRYFEDGSALNLDAVRTKLRNSAFLVPGVTYVLRDLTSGDLAHSEEFCFTNGLADMVDFHTPSADRPICDVISITGEGTYKENAADENGVMRANVERVMEVDIALRWSTGYESTVACFTNTIPNANGGSHRKGVERALARTLGDAIKGGRGLLKAKEDLPILDDYLEGLTAVIHVRVPEPQFKSQTKEELATPGVVKATQALVEQALKAWVEGKKTKNEARQVLTKIVDASRVRLTQKAQKETARRKTALEGAAMPAKLVDCKATGTARSELFLVEGDSALGSARRGRSAEYQALLPLRGKVLNVQKATLADALKNEEIASIIQTLGAGSGRTFDLSQMRYERVLVMADADSDGSHIRCLLIVLFFRYLRPVVDAGRLFSAMPPLHKVSTKGKGAETIYTFTEREMRETVARLERAGKQVVTPVPRFKGLGEMDAEVLWETTMNPATRAVRQITAADAEAAEAMLDLAMGSAVPPRKKWIMEAAGKVDRDALEV